MVSSITNNSYFNEAVSGLYTADSTAKLVKTTLKEFFEANKGNNVSSAELVKNVLNYKNDDENSNKSIADLLKNYAHDTSKYIKNLGQNHSNNNIISNNKLKSFNQLTKSDYEKAGMSGYYEAQANLKMSKAITAYSLNNSSYAKNSTFKINVL